MQFTLNAVSSKFGAWKADRQDLKKAIEKASKKHEAKKDVIRIKNIVWTMLNAVIDELEFEARCELDERVEALFDFAK